MPSSNLFAISNRGRVYVLQTDSSIWKEILYLGLDFKRVSAHDSVVWALGGDHQIYVYVYGTSVPIRVCEEAFENQRWNPVEGFTSNLLPTDRPPFSSADGLIDRKLSNVHLPSLAWNWEGPWHLQDTFEGKALDKECWTYSVDFPRTYTAEKKWNSCVMRRKWIRYRRYIALDTWSAVPSIHKDHTEEPFIDICVGGGDVPGADPDCLMVWGITALGKVMVRGGISSTSPEGCKWTFVPTPPNQDLISLSVSRSGRVWAATWDGSVLVRMGISRENLGVGWSIVDPPGNSSIQHLAVGISVVWAVCRDSSLWFRRGFTSEDTTTHNFAADNNDLGTSWLQMVGSFLIVSIGPADQVWALTADDHSLVIRTGITSCELSGKTWKIINLPLLNFDPDAMNEEEGRSSSDEGERGSPIPILGFQDVSVIEGNCDVSSQDSGAKQKLEGICEGSSQDSGVEQKSEGNCEGSSQDSGVEQKSEGNCEGSSQDSGVKQKSEGNCDVSSQDSGVEQKSEGNVVCSQLDAEKISLVETGIEQNILEMGLENLAIETGSSFGQIVCSDFSDVKANNCLASSVISDTRVKTTGSNCSAGDSVSRDSPLDSLNVGSESSDSAFGKESCSLSDSKLRTKLSSGGSSSGSDALVGRGSLGQEEQPFFDISIPNENSWMWISGGGCWINAHNLPKWFIADYSNFAAKEPWRQDIVTRLTDRNLQIKGFTGEAIESSSWEVEGQCRFLVGGQWAPASLQLQMFGAKGREVREASITVSYTLGSKKKILISCCSVVLNTLTVDFPSKAVVSLYICNQPLTPLSFLFSAEKDAEEWMDHVSSACSQFRGLSADPSACTIWAITHQGFVYLHDFSSSEQELRIESRAAHRAMVIEDGRTPVCCRLERGLRPGYFITVKGKVLEDGRRFDINLLLDENGSNIALHLNPRFYEKTIVLNSKEDGEWNHEERHAIRPLAKGGEYELTFLCDDTEMKISVDGKLIYRFSHRLMPADIAFVKVEGDFFVSGIVYNYGAGEKTMRDYFWQPVGGHLKAIEGGAGGVTWGVSYDSHVYIFQGRTGGGVNRGASSSDFDMSDIRHFYVWENQRWNPVTGFTYRGLPTDRNTWSDQSGKVARTKEGTKLPSRHWQWIGDWSIDHHTPDGVDKDGWQYATDFPMSYHGHRYITDLVRRRRWVRKCRIATSGPWQQMEKVMLTSVSVSPNYAEDGTVPVWGVSVSNEVVFREGVIPTCMKGSRWILIPSECPMKKICAGIDGGVWSVSCIGQAHYRIGVTKANPKGCDWVNVDAPTVALKDIGCGSWKVWAIDQDGSLYYRTNVQQLFPEGTAWKRVCGDVERISVSADGSLWAVLRSFPTDEGQNVKGVMAKRNGVCGDFPGGTSWDVCAGTGWNFVSARLPIP